MMTSHPEIFKPQRGLLPPTGRHPRHATQARVNIHSSSDMVWIENGRFTMGSDKHYPEEAPAHEASLDGFWIDRGPVTNDEFSRFIQATGYTTVAERVPDAALYPDATPELLVPASVVSRRPKESVDLNNHLNWWA